MASLPTGSNKILEVQSGNIYVVIKSKTPHSKVTNQSILSAKSKVRVIGFELKSVKILGEEKFVDDNGVIGVSEGGINTIPLFFEQTDYEIIVKSINGDDVSLWHENHAVREKVSPVMDSSDLISGIINFGNCAGFSEFKIYSNGKKVLVIRVEVFPSKISYKEDYQDMLQDISNEIYGAVLDFMSKTFKEFSIGKTQTSIPALFFEIIKRIYCKFINAANTIISSPHHKLNIEHPVVPSHKVKKTDNKTIEWLLKHPENVVKNSTGYTVIKAPTVQKHITYNTTENQFTKFIIKTVVRKLTDFKDRYEKSTRTPESDVVNTVDNMVSGLNKLISNSFFKDVDDYRATQSMSLVFSMAPGYKELFKYYLMMHRGLTLNGDVFRMSLKDTAQLYEYWCFIKLVSLMKKNYQLASPDVIKIDNTGVTVSLVKGRKSEVKFINPRTGERIVLAYNPGEQNTQTVNQKPDNVLTLDKRGSDVEYKYVFDAKYRIENNPSDPFYPDNEPGPKVSDINTMHRYRDSIVYENKGPSRFMFEKTMFGAYVLFPYDNPEGIYTNHKFYKSIESVNIGGLPFLPGTTDLVERFLSELIADSEESAFERASLPRGIEEKLAKVDWSVKDVLVGSLSKREQLEYCLGTNHYYTPKTQISEAELPVKYIALYEDNIGTIPGIKYFGQVILATEVERGKIPVKLSRNNPKEKYYYFKIREWTKLPSIIEIKDTNRKPRFTNKFLLDNCKESYQLFNINSEAEYRLIMELNAAFDNMVADTSANSEAVYRIDDSHIISTIGGKFTIINSAGNIIDEISAEDFSKHPRLEFNKIKKIVSKG